MKLSQSLRRFCLCILAVLLPACFPVSTPPLVYSPSPSLSDAGACRSIVLIEESTPEVEFLGFQMLFAFIPFTRVYTPEQSSRLLAKEIEGLFWKHGYCVIRTQPAYRAELMRQSGAHLAIQVQSVSSGATAYDAIFFRYLRAGIEAELLIYSGADTSPVKLPLRLEESAFSKSGFSSELLTLLRKSVKDGVAGNLDAFLLAERRRRGGTKESDTPVLFVRTRVASGAAAAFRRLEADFDSRLPRQLWSLEIAQRIQRGVSLALNEVVHGSLLAGGGADRQSDWSLDVLVRGLDLVNEGETLRMLVQYRLSKNRHLIQSSRCSLQTQLSSASQVLPLLALEQLAQGLTEMFYFQEKSLVSETKMLCQRES